LRISVSLPLQIQREEIDFGGHKKTQKHPSDRKTSPPQEFVGIEPHTPANLIWGNAYENTQQSIENRYPNSQTPCLNLGVDHRVRGEG